MRVAIMASITQKTRVQERVPLLWIAVLHGWISASPADNPAA
jgi:hypothetical protein